MIETKMEMEKQVRVISCKEMSLKKIILNGIITISTDLYLMDEKQPN